jgi:hypothetical protein
MCLLVVSSILGGCSLQNEVVSDVSKPDSNEGTESEPKLVTPDESEVFVIRAKYYQTTGPCIEIGDTLAMPVIDAFEVVEVLNGDLKVESINVLAMTEGGSTYPKEMEEGKVYTLRLTPSERTTKQLRENQKKGRAFLWIDGDEIEEQGAVK